MSRVIQFQGQRAAESHLDNVQLNIDPIVTDLVLGQPGPGEMPGARILKSVTRAGLELPVPAERPESPQAVRHRARDASAHQDRRLPVLDGLRVPQAVLVRDAA
jgi:hypothetical protein